VDSADLVTVEAASPRGNWFDDAGTVSADEVQRFNESET
jgi:hypothetical protein